MVNNIENQADPLFVGFREILNLGRDEAALFHSTFSERAATLVDSVDRWRQSQSRIRTKLTSDQPDDVRVGLGVFLVGHEIDSAQKTPRRARGLTRPRNSKRKS
jgi:hypothetical protein